MFDLNTLAFEETFDLHLKHPVTGDLLYADAEKTKPVVIKLYGQASKQYRNAMTALQNRQLKRQAKGGKEAMTAEMLREEGIALNVAASAGTENVANGDRPVKTAEDFKELYANPKLSWIGEQVNEALGDPANFLRQ